MIHLNNQDFSFSKTIKINLCLSLQGCFCSAIISNPFLRVLQIMYCVLPRFRVLGTYVDERKKRDTVLSNKFSVINQRRTTFLKKKDKHSIRANNLHGISDLKIQNRRFIWQIVLYVSLQAA